ncbi:MAG: iron ABC transporter substrate-binding protein [Deltaproteobacteria bacterium]|nr:MAG: iron ABC transporter substrate-binding protein [Deltaproteobacteria bacterium]
MRRICYLLIALCCLVFMPFTTFAGPTRSLVDTAGGTRTIPEKVNHVICSGAGCLRLLTYLQGQSMITGVDDMETRRSRFNARPYALAHPEFKTFPTFGEFRGHDHPEQILTLSPQPDVIFKTSVTMGTDPDELALQTGIPVVVLDVGDLGDYRQDLYRSLRIMGQIIGKEKRAEAVIDFFEAEIQAICSRIQGIDQKKPLRVYIGGVAFKGPHGFQSTEPDYPPFRFVGLKNVAYRQGLTGKGLRHSDVAKEKILEWNPDVLFMDLSTLQFGKQGGGLNELKTDPAYRSLDAVRQGRVYGVLPYNWYSQNYGSILANAWFIAKTLYPDRFKDIDPKAKANDIYTFLVGTPVFDTMNQLFWNLAFTAIPL